jgi:hypothetical protein
MTSSLYGDGPPLVPAPLSSQVGDPNDLTFAYYSSAVSHLSTLLLLSPAVGSGNTTPSASPTPVSVLHYHTHAQLLVALSNVLHVALRHFSFPATPTLPPGFLPQPLAATPSSTATSVISPASSAPAAADAAVGVSSDAVAAAHRPITSLPQSSPPPATSPSQSYPLAVRVLTAIQPVRPTAASGSGLPTGGRLPISTRPQHISTSSRWASPLPRPAAASALSVARTLSNTGGSARSRTNKLESVRSSNEHEQIRAVRPETRTNRASVFECRTNTSRAWFHRQKLREALR